MKRFILTLVSLTLFYTIGFSQVLSDGEMIAVNNLLEGFKIIFSYINWVFLIIFIVVAWLINDITDAKNIASWLLWLKPIPKAIRALIVGILLIILFTWVFKLKTPFEIFKLIISLLFSMVVFKIGIDKVLKAISTRLFGLKFE